MRHDAATPHVWLDVATPADTTLLSNLLELYIHDLSDVFPRIELGADGRFGYDKLPLYWSEPDRRFAFVIRCDGRVAGFALATRDDAGHFDIAEFFVMRRYRRRGVGRDAAFLLWKRFPGMWTVRVSEGNASGVHFWTGIIAECAGGPVSPSVRRGDPHDWRVFTFEARAS